jgi:hypothetical protein
MVRSLLVASRVGGTLCPAGFFCTTMAAAPTVCPIGYYCTAGTANTTLARCSGGAYGSITGLQSPGCSGFCAAGYYCPPGSTSAQAAQCNTSAVYCPAAVQAPVSVSSGYFSVPVGGLKASAQVPCGVGAYCYLGVQIPCPAGVYGDQAQATSPACAGACASGYYCPAASTKATAVSCGNVTVYCPAGAAAPLHVLNGYYSVNGADATTQSAQSLCTLGSYCVGGVRSDCPFGVYGATMGLQSAVCSGTCLPGYVCPVGSHGGSSLLCPAGFFCNRGAVTACRTGTYNAKAGQWSVDNCTACPANTFNPVTNVTARAGCTPCAVHENSTAGASECWPGIVSAVASNPPPIIPALSARDVLTITFTKPTNQPPAGTDAQIHALLVFSSPIGVGLVGAWNAAGTVLAISVGSVAAADGSIHVDLAATRVGVLTVSLNSSAYLQDAALVSQHAAYAPVLVSGTWGVSHVPGFLLTAGSSFAPSFAANTGGQAGLGVGDSLVLRFDNPCKQLPLGTKDAIDRVFMFSPPLGTSYTGAWQTTGVFALSAVTITVTGVLPAGANATPTAVGVLQVSVLLSAGMTSLDESTEASNSSTVIALGTWGDVPSASAVMRSHQSLSVSIEPPKYKYKYKIYL